MDIFRPDVWNISLILRNGHILRRNRSLTSPMPYSVVARTVARLVHVILAPRIELVDADVFTLVF